MELCVRNRCISVHDLPNAAWQDERIASAIGNGWYDERDRFVLLILVDDRANAADDKELEWRIDDRRIALRDCYGVHRGQSFKQGSTL